MGKREGTLGAVEWGIRFRNQLKMGPSDTITGFDKWRWIEQQFRAGKDPEQAAKEFKEKF